MTYSQLVSEIKRKQSFLCVGLDTDINKIPRHLLSSDDPVFEFNRQIIDATKDFCVAYKPNIAFYESMGVTGWQSLRKTLEYIPENIFSIADAKRGDIGNTSTMYAKTFFEQYNFHSVTVAPYMGNDSVKPFLEFKNKWVILLALTSNPGANDFQNLPVSHINSDKLFESVLKTSSQWGSKESMMYVVGATRAEMFKQVRKIVPDHFLLVPGVGAQGGDLNEVCQYGLNSNCGLLVNASRSIIYAGNDTHFALKAADEAKSIRNEMKSILSANKIV
jgi:orotidine-5'-phosphate decarboxylase